MGGNTVPLPWYYLPYGRLLTRCLQETSLISLRGARRDNPHRSATLPALHSRSPLTHTHSATISQNEGAVHPLDRHQAQQWHRPLPGDQIQLRSYQGQISTSFVVSLFRKFWFHRLY